jgi:hypothetical protein
VSVTWGAGAVRGGGGGGAGRLPGVRGKSGAGGFLVLAARTRGLDGPPADRASNEDVMDGAFEVGRADTLPAQVRKPLADLFLVPLVRGVAAFDAQRDGTELGQILFHLLIHAFIVGSIPVAMQDRDRYSLARRDLESQSRLLLASQSRLRLESSHHIVASQ